MKQPIFKSIAVSAALGLCASSFASSKLDGELSDIHKILSELAAEVQSSWITKDGTSLSDISDACAKKVTGTLSTSIGGTNTVKTAVCDDNGLVTVTLRAVDINKTLREGVFKLQGVKKTDSVSEGFKKLERDELYGGTATNLLPLDTFVCQFDFGGNVAAGDKQDIQLSQPEGTTVKTDHFARAEASISPRKDGINGYCKGSIKSAILAETPVDDLENRTAD